MEKEEFSSSMVNFPHREIPDQWKMRCPAMSLCYLAAGQIESRGDKEWGETISLSIDATLMQRVRLLQCYLRFLTGTDRVDDPWFFIVMAKAALDSYTAMIHQAMSTTSIKEKDFPSNMRVPSGLPSNLFEGLADKPWWNDFLKPARDKIIHRGYTAKVNKKSGEISVFREPTIFWRADLPHEPISHCFSDFAGGLIQGLNFSERNISEILLPKINERFDLELDQPAKITISWSITGARGFGVGGV